MSDKLRHELHANVDAVKMQHRFAVYFPADDHQNHFTGAV